MRPVAAALNFRRAPAVMCGKVVELDGRPTWYSREFSVIDLEMKTQTSHAPTLSAKSSRVGR